LFLQAGADHFLDFQAPLPSPATAGKRLVDCDKMLVSWKALINPRLHF